MSDSREIESKQNLSLLMKGSAPFMPPGAVFAPPDDPPAPPPVDPNKPADPPPVDPNKPADPPVDPNKPKEPEKKEPEKPEPITADSIKLPEGVEVDKEAVGKFAEIMNNADLNPQARAQALVDLQVDLMKQASEKGSQAWLDTVQQWETEAAADPVIGGDKLPQVLANVSKLIDEHAVDKDGKADPKFAQELREVFDLTGIGSNPKMVRFLNGLATKLSVEGTPVSGKPGGAPRTHAEILYPNQGKT